MYRSGRCLGLGGWLMFKGTDRSDLASRINCPRSLIHPDVCLFLLHAQRARANTAGLVTSLAKSLQCNHELEHVRDTFFGSNIGVLAGCFTSDDRQGTPPGVR